MLESGTEDVFLNLSPASGWFDAGWATLFSVWVIEDALYSDWEIWLEENFLKIVYEIATTKFSHSMQFILTSRLHENVVAFEREAVRIEKPLIGHPLHRGLVEVGICCVVFRELSLVADYENLCRLSLAFLKKR